MANLRVREGAVEGLGTRECGEKEAPAGAHAGMARVGWEKGEERRR
jgi:hypothetical protein